MSDTTRTFITTFSGIEIPVMGLTPDMVKIEDIAHSLSGLVRYLRHTKQTYRVAQHCCLVSSLIAKYEQDDDEAAYCGLLHDAAEAYTGDYPSPYKQHVPGLKDFDRAMETMVCKALGLPPADDPVWAVVKKYDNVALHLEGAVLFQKSPSWVKSEIVEKYKEELPWSCWSEELCHDSFMLRYRRLKPCL